MCEIVRGLIAGGVIEGSKIEELSESSIEGIDCPGEGDEGQLNSLYFIGQSEICAVSGGSPSQKYAWYILLEGISITANNLPKWELNPKTKERLNAKKAK